MPMRLMIDAHLDLGWCACSFDRDLTLSVEAIREREAGMTDEYGRGTNVLTLPELRNAGIGIAVATLLARGGPDQPWREGFKRTDLDYATQAIAYSAAHGQLAYYRLLEKQGHVRFIYNRREFDAHWQAYNKAPDTTPLGIILSMEGADPIVDVDQVQYWWEQGLRAVGPAHYGRSHYAYGTGVDGPLTERGVELLKAFEKTGIILDVTHLSDKSFWHAMDVYNGPLLASHHNCRALVPGDRQLTDDQIKTLIQRDAVIGASFDAWMLYPNWIRGQTKPDVVGIEAAADHIDHITQIAGNVRHSAIGSDLDGGFGYEQTPRDLKRITDLQKLADILSKRKYSDADIDAIFHGNWIRFFRRTLPA
jgi:membrane dipeptidase